MNNNSNKYFCNNQKLSSAFKFSALSLSLAAAMPLSSSYANEIKELATTQATAQDEASYKVDHSTSVKYVKPIINTAKSITVISQAVMKDRNVDSLQGALRNVSGISMAAGEGGTPTGDSMSIRGFSASNNIMIDNIRDIAGYTRDMYNVEQVEVAKGPGSAVYGRGAAGGSINLQTKTAKLDDFADVSFRLGTEKDYRAQVDLNKKIDDSSALRINLLVDDGEVAGRDSVETSNNAIAVAFATGINSNSRFVINADIQKQDNIPDYGLPWVPNYDNNNTRVVDDSIAAWAGSAPPVNFSNFYGNLPRDFEEIDGQSLTASYEYDFSESTTLRAASRIGSVQRVSIVTAPRFHGVKTGNVTVYGSGVTLGDEKTRDTEDSIVAFQLDLISHFSMGDIQHDLVTGLELSQEKFERWNYVDIVDDNLDSTPIVNDLYNPNPNLAFTGQYARTTKSNEAIGDSTALYIFDTLTFSPQWELSLGLRWDIFDTEYFYDLAGKVPTVNKSQKDEELSYNIGLIFKPTKSSSIYFGAGNSFSPSAEDLTAGTSGNDADLDPEETISYELGTKWDLYDGKLFASAAIFRTEKVHAKTDDPYAEDSRADTLNGKQRVDGLELSIAGQLTNEFSINAAYTFQDSEVVNAEGEDSVQIGQELARTPKNSFSLWTRYDFNESLAAGFGAQYVDERYNSSDPGSREQADDYLIFDFMVSYQINDQWMAQLNGSNLTDEEYIDKIGGGHFVPGEGRYVTLTTSYSF